MKTSKTLVLLALSAALAAGSSFAGELAAKCRIDARSTENGEWIFGKEFAVIANKAIPADLGLGNDLVSVKLFENRYSPDSFGWELSADHLPKGAYFRGGGAGDHATAVYGNKKFMAQVECDAPAETAFYYVGRDGHVLLPGANNGSLKKKTIFGGGCVAGDIDAAAKDFESEHGVVKMHYFFKVDQVRKQAYLEWTETSYHCEQEGIETNEHGGVDCLVWGAPTSITLMAPACE
ncbi:MAG: hypothetical protein JST04_15695 [Bdellovibrionales bacterium]|nr:hypothetical protein [Bdellovibrionales bacterium]